jgi:hypothetical protein
MSIYVRILFFLVLTAFEASVRAQTRTEIAQAKKTFEGL